MSAAFWRDVLVSFAVCALIGVLLCLASIASAQEDDATALILAQAAVAEAGWIAHEDHAAIWHVLRKRAERADVPIADMAIRYVAIYRVGSARSRWVRGLRLDAQRPDGWPQSLSWSAHVPRWLAVVDRARAFMRGEVADPCPRAMDWGGDMDTPQGRMVRAACAGARGLANRFYRVEGRR